MSRPVTPLSPGEIGRFREFVERTAETNRRDLPWRTTTDPYRIMVSEIMLQQTQVERVVPKYGEFVARFPDIPTLAGAPLSEVLACWQGLGYNRRGVMLQGACQEIVERRGGEFPRSRPELVTLPGIGPYTAGAILAFAFDLPETFVETNIRALYIHWFFPGKERVHDRELLPLVEATMDRTSPRRWYNMLMDAGAAVKKLHSNPSRRSVHHLRQSPFEGSNRQLRSRILRLILANPGITLGAIVEESGSRPEPVERNLSAMEREGLVKKDGAGWKIP